jgi:hypothetical protein
LSGYFCGNPRNHEEHSTDLGQCEGIHRPVIKEEVIVEKWEPPKQDVMTLEFHDVPREPAVPYDPEAAGEVRTTSSTGGMKGVKPERYSLIPVEALDIMARLYAFGAEKYEAHNWRNGYEWSKSFDSLFRHATSALKGEDIDPETGLPHLAGAAFHCFTLMVFMEEHPEFDDRWKPEGQLEA